MTLIQTIRKGGLVLLIGTISGSLGLAVAGGFGAFDDTPTTTVAEPPPIPLVTYETLSRQEQALNDCMTAKGDTGDLFRYNSVTGNFSIMGHPHPYWHFPEAVVERLRTDGVACVTGLQQKGVFPPAIVSVPQP